MALMHLIGAIATCATLTMVSAALGRNIHNVVRCVFLIVDILVRFYIVEKRCGLVSAIYGVCSTCVSVGCDITYNSIHTISCDTIRAIVLTE